EDEPRKLGLLLGVRDEVQVNQDEEQRFDPAASMRKGHEHTTGVLQVQLPWPIASCDTLGKDSAEGPVGLNDFVQICHQVLLDQAMIPCIVEVALDQSRG